MVRLLTNSDLPHMKDYERQLFVGLTIEQAEKLASSVGAIFHARGGKLCPHCGRGI